MPFTTTYANNILNFISGRGGLEKFSKVYIGLTSNNPEKDEGAIVELSGGGYSRVLLTQTVKIETGTREETIRYPDLLSAASNRMISNPAQINWTKATSDWMVNGFILSASEAGEPFFYGALELTEEQKAAGGLLVEAGAVALFDPQTFKIEFPTEDVSPDVSA